MKEKGFAPIFIIFAVILVIGLVAGAIFLTGRGPDLLNSDLSELKEDPINKIMYPNAKLVATVYDGTQYDAINKSISGAYVEKVFVSQDPQKAIYSFYKESAANYGINPEAGYEEEFTFPCLAGDITILEKSYGSPEGRGCSGNFVNSSPPKDYFKISFPSKNYPRYISYGIEFVSRRIPYISNIRFFDNAEIKNFDFSSYETAYILRIHTHY